ncbi:MAG: hypothetical protein PHF86_03185 [Candidatus Nanoarchaeia archaeon]|jgi:hypothetical protein|nr:hypothetical protein [Candidatus Nanoarchaeia archaeon]
MKIIDKQSYRSEGRGVNETDNVYRVVLVDVTQRELFEVEAWIAKRHVKELKSKLKCEIIEDLSEIESHSKFIQRKSVRVRELVERLLHD